MLRREKTVVIICHGDGLLNGDGSDQRERANDSQADDQTDDPSCVASRGSLTYRVMCCVEMQLPAAPPGWGAHCGINDVRKMR